MSYPRSRIRTRSASAAAKSEVARSFQQDQLGPGDALGQDPGVLRMDHPVLGPVQDQRGGGDLAEAVAHVEPPDGFALPALRALVRRMPRSPPPGLPHGVGGLTGKSLLVQLGI